MEATVESSYVLKYIIVENTATKPIVNKADGSTSNDSMLSLGDASTLGSGLGLRHKGSSQHVDTAMFP